MTARADIQVDQLLDCRGLACPMPIVRTKKAIDIMQAGQVVEVQATDRGSLADIQGWAKNTGHQYLGTLEDGDVLKHYLRKSSPEEVKEEKKYAVKATNDELQIKLAANERITVLDVREPAEYAFLRIPGSKSLPFGELENRLQELNSDDDIYVICHTGSRSDLACQLLTEKGFKRVTNIIPGMSSWTGPTEKNTK